MTAPSKGNLLGGCAAPLAITGAGLVSPAGCGVDALRGALVKRRSCLGRLPWLERDREADIGVKIGGDIGEDIGGLVEESVLDRWRQGARGQDPAVVLAALAASEALEAGGIVGERIVRERIVRERIVRERIGLCVGTALGASGAFEEAIAEEAVTGRSVSPDGSRFAFEAFAESLGRALSSAAPAARWLPPSIFSVTCASGLCAVEQAAADLALGRTDLALAGGVDTLTRLMHSGFKALGALSPSGRLRPFSIEHDGVLIGEAAAFVLLEPLEQARIRGASTRGCVLSQRLVSDAHHMTSPDPEGRGMARAIVGALRDACLAPADLGGVTVTAAGSAVYDRMLSRALHAALGSAAAERVPVSTWECSTGHLLAATGALGYVYASMALDQGFLDQAFGASQLDPECRLRYAIGRPEPLLAPSVLALTVGFGGQNGAALVTSESLAADLAARARGGSS